MNITHNYLSLDKRARGLSGEPVFFARAVDTVVLHWNGPYPNQSPITVRDWFERGSDGNGIHASYHFVVKDGVVLQLLPLTEVAWHSGDSRNRHSIGVCAIPENEAGEFSNATIETLRDVVAYIRTCHPDAVLTRHYDGTQKKDCPRFYTAHVTQGEGRWAQLRDLLNGGGR
jgi:N-acetyl-anhydromuramyl-L-alanine amidase AmpD